MGRYSLGIDFGTLSARCILADLETGHEMVESQEEYAHGVMDEALPDGTPLGNDWALQHPQDYLDALRLLVTNVLGQTGIDATDIVGVGIDFTACTVLPVKKDGTPLCMLEQYRSEPNAYVKLWKHHAAQPEADDLNRIAAERGERFLKRYGGKISSEWLFPKIWQVLKEAPQVYADMDYFPEACDWMVFQLCGKWVQSSSGAGYKAMWSKADGFPSPDFFRALDPRLENVVQEKLGFPVQAIGTKAGEVSKAGARLTGLAEGTAVAVGHLDAHVATIGAGVTRPGQMMVVMGTSACDMLISDAVKEVPGMCGVCEDGIVPGYVGYEAGQSCSGDHYQWFVENCVPQEYNEAAKARGMNIYQYLAEKAGRKLPGESGLIALDWWNGNRSVLVDAKLSGTILGCTLLTKPEDVYRALIEATAYGTRKIFETLEQQKIPVDEIYIAGGIAKKDPFVMQIYSDILKKEIRVVTASQVAALSSAMWGAVVAGKAMGGFASLEEAVRVMVKSENKLYTPKLGNSEVYDSLFEEYKKLHDYFGCGGNDVMKRLKKLSEQQKKRRRGERK